MQVVGRHDLDAVEILLLLQKLPEIRVAGDAPEVLRCPLLRVVGFDDLLRHVPTGADAGDSASPIGVFQDLAHAVADPGLVPIDVVRAVLDGITYRRDLYVRSSDQPQHLAGSLSAAPDVRQSELVAGSGISRATQYVSRNDGERQPGSGRGQKLATIDIVFGRHGALLTTSCAARRERRRDCQGVRADRLAWRGWGISSRDHPPGRRRTSFAPGSAQGTPLRRARSRIRAARRSVPLGGHAPAVARRRGGSPAPAVRHQAALLRRDPRQTACERPGLQAVPLPAGRVPRALQILTKIPLRYSTHMATQQMATNTMAYSNDAFGGLPSPENARW